MDWIIRLLNIIGALGLFLYGMKQMSESLQQLAGGRLRKLLGGITASPLSQISSTALLTAIVQSSSAVTVLIVSFVNAGLLSLPQSIGMILGANIGTTSTAWVLAYFNFEWNLSLFSLPLIGAGAILLLQRNHKIRRIGEIIVGFSLIFLALSLLQFTLGGVSPETDFYQKLASYANQGYVSILLFLLLGILLTAILQSSTATMTFTLLLCMGGWIPLEAASAMIVGENIGTTVTANLAAVVANTTAKRAALSHTLVNVIGALWVVPLIPWIVPGMDALFSLLGVSAFSAIPFELALFHTAFNTANVLLLAAFIPQLARLVTRMVADNGREVPGGETPRMGWVTLTGFNYIQVNKQLSEYSRESKDLFMLVREMLNATDAEQVYALAEETRLAWERFRKNGNQLFRRFSDAMARSDGAISDTETRRLLTVFLHLEKTGALNRVLSEILLEKKRQNKWFSPQARQLLQTLFSEVEQAYYFMMRNIQSATPESRERASQMRSDIENLVQLGLSTTDSSTVEINTASDFYRRVLTVSGKLSEELSQASFREED